jgi:LEA14-like dessication related protein
MMLAGIVLGMQGGCASGPAIKSVRAERVAATDEATELRVTLELTNPNDSPLELTEWDYSAAVNGRTVYRGIWVAALTLPSGVPMTAELPVVVPAADTTDWANATWTVGGSVGYRATRQLDRLLYQLGINRLSAGFDVRGQTVVDTVKAAP